MQKFLLIMLLPLLFAACKQQCPVPAGNQTDWEIRYYEPTDEEIAEVGYGSWVTEVHPYMDIRVSGAFACDGESDSEAVLILTYNEGNFFLLPLHGDSVAPAAHEAYTLTLDDDWELSWQTTTRGEIFLSFGDGPEVRQLLEQDGVMRIDIRFEGEHPRGFTFALDRSGAKAAFEEYDKALAEAYELNGF